MPIYIILQSSSSNNYYYNTCKQKYNAIHVCELILMWFQAMKAASPSFEPVSMDSEDKLFIMFTSGTSGIPRSISHSTAGYLLYAAVTQKVTVTYTVKFTKSNNNISLFCSTSLTTRLVTSLHV